MAYLLIRHKTRDYATWKAAFDAFNETRRASGEKSYQIFHPDDDPNNLWLLFEWDNLENARAFIGQSGFERDDGCRRGSGTSRGILSGRVRPGYGVVIPLCISCTR